jgi:hypothetical protein
MAALHETAIGERLITVTLPRLADELVLLNDNLRALVAVLRQRVAAEAGVPIPVHSDVTPRRSQ